MQDTLNKDYNKNEIAMSVHDIQEQLSISLESSC